MTRKHLLGVTAALLVGGFASCKEPTQIALSLSTDTLCKGEEANGPRLNDVAILAAAKLDPNSLVPTGTTENCEPPKSRSAADAAAYVGSLVLVPDAARTGSQIDVLVVAGVENDNPKAVDQSKSMTAAACLDLLASKTPISGTACIVARRNVGFVDNLPLVLPIELERDCIGKECGEDQTCFHGNCVSSKLDCAGSTPQSPDCAPKGCTQSCGDGCLSKSGTCEAGSCTCASCDATTCADSCAFEGKDGACSADGTECRCQELCNPGSCTMFCGGDCNPGQAECVCPTCDAMACAMTTCGNGQPATCNPTCQCSGTSCADVTLQCATGQTEEQVGDACVCQCNQAACDLDCTAVGSSGGMCNADESCSCLPACPEPPSCTAAWATPTDECVDGGWVCVCDEPSCDAFCGPNNTGTCTSPSQCDCSPIGGTGGGGVGAGNQGAGGAGAGQGAGGNGAGNQGAGGAGAGQGAGGNGGGNCGYQSACLDPGLCSSTNCNGYAGAGADCDANCNCQNCISDPYCDCDCKKRGAPNGACAPAIAGGPDCVCGCGTDGDCASVCGSGKVGTCSNNECLCSNGSQTCITGMHGSFNDLGSCQQACTQGLCPNCANNGCVQYSSNPPMFTCICQP